MIKKKISFININTREVINKSVFLLKTPESECIIRFRYTENGADLNFKGQDFFISFCNLRDWIFQESKLLPLCKGALKNVYPSRMSRQMSDGLTAYQFTLNQPATEENLVDIFESIKEEEIINLTTPIKQTEYFKNWLESL